MKQKITLLALSLIAVVVCASCRVKLGNNAKKKQDKVITIINSNKDTVLIISSGSIDDLDGIDFSKIGNGNIDIKLKNLDDEKDNSPVITRNIPAEKIYSITNNTTIDVEIEEGKPGITITGPERKVDRIKFTNRGGALTITASGPLNNANTIKIRISSSELNELILQGTGNYTGTRLYSSSLSLKLNGTGDIRIGDVQTSSLKAIVNGTGDIRFSTLSATTAQLVANGTGDIDVARAKTVTMNVRVNGTGDCTVNSLSSNEVDVAVAATGDAVLQDIDVNTLKANAVATGDIKISGRAKRATLSATGNASIDARKLKSERLSHSTSCLGDIYL